MTAGSRRRRIPAAAPFCGLLLLLVVFAAILRAELIGAVGAAQRRIGIFPEALRIHHDAQLPDQPVRKGHQQQRAAIEAADRQQRRKHHQVIPVEDAAGRAAFCLDDQPERTPDQHADEVTDIKHNRNHEQCLIVQDAPDPQQ